MSLNWSNNLVMGYDSNQCVHTDSIAAESQSLEKQLGEHLASTVLRQYSSLRQSSLLCALEI